MAGTIADESVSSIDVGFCIPLVLLLNYSLFQYLFTTYYTRRHESRVRLLLFIAFLSFASVIPFALRDPMLRRNLNDVSEVCSVLTFLMQIVIITRDVTKRMKIKEILRLMWCAELLVIGGMSVLILNAIDLFTPIIDMDLVELIDNIVEHIALVFIVGFRFYFLVIAKGLPHVLATQKTELVVYTLFLTHEIPFHLIQQATNQDLHHAQGLWMRVTITMCLAMTIKARLSSQSSAKRFETGGVHKKGPMTSSFYPEKSSMGPPLPVSSVGDVVPMHKESFAAARTKSQPKM